MALSFGEIVQIVLFIGLLIGLTPILGGYMARVFQSERNLLSFILRPVESVVYAIGGVNSKNEQNWVTYTVALLAFNILGFLVLFVMLLAQASLPLNPANLPNLSPALAFNTAASFMTNTNWQSYAGEVTMSYFSQMVGLTVQNFVSAATGIAVVVALTRGLARRTASTIGNFWVDLTRATLYVLLPLSLILAVVLVSQGVVQTFDPYKTVTTVEGAEQVIPLGPAASQIAIKQLGTNGGGFFNTNSAHPLENPTPISNFLQVLSILVIPAALTYTYGVMVGSRRQGWSIFAAMFALFAIGLLVSLLSEYTTNPIFGLGGLMEGKEQRFGVANSVLWSVATTAASNGSVNAMHASLSPLSGMIALINMLLGEVIFGGVGAGLYGMLAFVIITVFIAGLMVGRTPEYLGKKIEAREIKMAYIAILIPSAFVLMFTALATVVQAGLVGRLNAGPHGFSEIFYAFASASNNNGSAFGGLTANTDFYNTLLGIAMLAGRFGVIIPMLAIAGSMVVKKTTPPSPGTFPTDKALFVGLLCAVVLIVGALTFFPALSLGPIVEHFLMLNGRPF